MTDTVEEVQVEQTEEAEKVRPPFPDPLAEAAFKQIEELTEKRNTAVGQINAVKGDPQSLKESLRESSEVKAAVDARRKRDAAIEALDKAESALDSAIEPEFNEARSNAEGKVAELEASVKEQDKTVKAATNYLKSLHPQLIEFLPALKRLSGGARSGGGATGTKRVRGFSIGVDKGEGFVWHDNMSAVAKDLNIETADLQAAFFEAAKAETSKDAPDEVSWAMEIGEGDDANVVNFRAERQKEETSDESDDDATDEGSEEATE